MSPNPPAAAAPTRLTPLAAIRAFVRDRRRSLEARRGRGPRVRPAVAALVATLLGLLALLGLGVAFLSPDAHGREVSLDHFDRAIAAGQIGQASFHDEDSRIAITYNNPGESKAWVAYPKSDSVTADLVDALRGAGVQTTVDPQSGKATARLLLSVLLPLMILANLFALIVVGSRHGASGIGEVVTFGTIGQRKLRPGQAHPVGFDDVAGADEAVVELVEVVDYLKDPARYEALGAAPPKGVLLFGPPGCGKTLLAKAVAGEAGVPFVSVAGAEFVESLVGVGAARVRDLFARVRAVAPAIVFIDELDAAGRRRGGGEGGSEERDQTLNQLLVEMDGFEVSAGIVVIAATNRPDIIDPALMRPGRFDRHITVPLPDPEGRERILALHARKRPVVDGVDFAALAERTPGFSGADLANVVNEATLLAIRDERTTVEPRDFDLAIRRLVEGSQRQGVVLDAEERHRLARYEGGRAVVATALGRQRDVPRVSILARAAATGQRQRGADADAALLSAGQLRARIVAALAGTAAEEIAFGEPSTHAEADLETASDLAMAYVTRYGMSALGKRRLVGTTTDSFLDGSASLGSLSEELHRSVDAEIAALLASAHSTAAEVLRQRSRSVDLIVQRLLEEEHIEGEALDALLLDVKPATVDVRTNGRAPRRRKVESVGRA